MYKMASRVLGVFWVRRRILYRPDLTSHLITVQYSTLLLFLSQGFCGEDHRCDVQRLSRESSKCAGAAERNP